ncbi:CGNR zinc finger domain-containing protein [Paenibacillus sp. P96]|uniref:CGNR zinc finger domain-containing protein n=1 Tax=Paenibacillus zeirhizosphaerae TaxID=2987519 RepID=A0ABT9FNQ3_9BACL|nr:CGNR zinc finger domain-containing protein [Paenibacillus sp. P96]MDP4096368.1 CGNR zinc finger domain-containing protein [Paenibacillus sp. P96]
MTAKFNFFSGNPSLDLINTEEMRRGKRIDSLSSQEDLVHWFQTLVSIGAFSPEQFGDLGEQPDESVLPVLKQFRATLRELFEKTAASGSPPVNLIEPLEKIIENAPLSYTYKEDRLIPVPIGSFPSSLLSLIALDALDICTKDKLQGLHRCENPKCIWFYLDFTGKRKWCSMKLCGNRMKASRFKLKYEGQPEESANP